MLNFRRKIDRIENESKKGLTKAIKGNINNFISYCQKSTSKMLRKCEIYTKMLTIETKESAISELSELIQQFSDSLYDPNLFPDIIGNQEHLEDNKEDFSNTGFSKKADNPEYGLSGLNTSPIISKFKNQIKHYEKENQELRAKLENSSGGFPGVILLIIIDETYFSSY